jgi:hypothetical protein
MGLVEEYRQEGFDADEVAGWREVVNDVATGAYSADDYLSTLEEDDAEDEDGGWDGYSEVEGLGEPAPVLSPDEALEALMLLPPEQMAQGIQYLEQNHPGLGQPLVEAYVDRQQREKLTENWLHLDNLNQVLAERQDRQAAEQDAQLAQAEVEARGLMADPFRAAGAGRVDVETGLRAAITVAETQVSNWQQAGYSPEQIDEMTTTGEFDRWCIETAAELGRQASIIHYALGKV